MARNDSTSDSNSEPNSPLAFSTHEERLLYASRHGDCQTVEQLLEWNSEDAIQLNINCKGTSKANLGWSPLHLAAYFGHVEVATLLLSYNADVNIVNNSGDTPLHRAAFTGRHELVALLIQYGADVTIVNGEGHMARDITHGDEVQKMLIATEQAQRLKLEQQLLAASAEGLLDHVQSLLFGPRPPNINCIDVTGNTPLHCASYRDQRDVAMLLLQHGANARLPNKKGHTPIDLAQSQHMKQLLNIKPVKVVHSVDKIEGSLLRSKFTRGLRKYWVVLDRGILTYYRKRDDAVAGIKRVGFRYLDHAEFKPSPTNSNIFTVQYSNNSLHTWILDSDTSKFSREDWLTALEDHRAYSDYYTTARTVDDDYDEISEDFLPLVSVADSLKTAQARQRLLEQSAENFQKLVETCLSRKTDDQASALEYLESLPEVQRQLASLTDASKSLCSTLAQCLASMAQQEELHKIELSQALEKSRVLQDGLQALAQEHHNLEQISRYSSLSGTFYDAKTEASCAGSPESLSERASLDLAGSLSDTDSFHSIMDGTSGSLERLHVADPEGQRSEKRSEEVSGEEKKLTANGVTDIVIPGCRRTKLPAVMIRRDQFSLWTVLKQCIGKELSKITMPVVFNEPLSFLQRFCEYTEHCQLLHKAAMNDDPVERIKYVATFAMAAGASNLGRLSKPFNPLLGETYELVREDMDIKIVLEQVSHHPPISAFHCTSPYFEFHGSVYPKLKFWGKSLEVLPKGVVTVTIPKYNETYTWHNPSSCLHNLIVGKLWIEMYGLLEMTNHKTGHKCFLHFKPAGWFGKDLHKVEGYITDKTDRKIVMLFGKWTEYLYAMEPEDYGDAKKEEKKRHRHSIGYGSGNPSDHVMYDSNLNPEGEEFNDAELLWRNTQRPDNSSQYYNFTLFAMRLNEVTEQMKTHLPPTDSRFRPDIRCMENGDIDSASDEKHRLEEKQRATRKHRAKTKEAWSPMWFKLDTNPNTGEQDWIYKGTYWNRNYSRSPDIF
ncbi:oxysterol-binding protein-related protein 1-like [Acanthaster planci]|uniref:Oxysterol-binding protein n=1 Tax=Acanthaster planci TaxID=133434 RepID=A0A8B7XT69_ACAPL|nr:oxysterol-binding protein-related protein 1-like [Acanthaster planci]XP_022083402.1 oxysterol-binding protein-related protein 1-like [Acanthaster planci]